MVETLEKLPPDLRLALTTGRGSERPFRCHMHDDRFASASVNSISGLWYCHACGAKGKVDAAEPPEPDVILDMLTLGASPRTYPLSWLNLFDSVAPEYWLQRFQDPQVVKAFRLGVHPTTGFPTFPVFEGPNLSRLAGVGMRRPNGKPRYVYPQGFSAAQSLGVPVAPWAPHQVVVLVEGIADAVALAMSGITAFACWGAGLHSPQARLLLELEVGVVLLGFDNDEAGRRATRQAMEETQIKYMASVLRWPNGVKDPGDMIPGDQTFNYVMTTMQSRGRTAQKLLLEQRSWWSGAYCKR